LAWVLAEKPDLGMASAMLLSPMTKTSRCMLDSKVRRSTGHQPLASTSSMSKASLPAFIGGMTLSTSALMAPCAVVTSSERASIF